MDFWSVVVILFLALFGPKNRRKSPKAQMQYRVLREFAIRREFFEHRAAKAAVKVGKEMRRRARELRREVFGSW